MFFALENQTRPTYSPFFFIGGPNDSVVVHELAHQWFGDSLAVHAWQHIWLNEGFASYAEWLWSEREGLGTAQEIFDSFVEIPADDPFWELAIGDPGPIQLFDFPVYGRGAMTLHALRTEVGDADFFKILQTWSKSQKNGTVTTREFMRLAERISGEDLDELFDEWLSAGRPASLPPAPSRHRSRRPPRAPRLPPPRYPGSGSHARPGHQAQGPARNPFSRLRGGPRVDRDVLSATAIRG